MAKKPITLVAATMFVAACAQNPDRIKPTYVDAGAYTAKTCEQLSRSYARINGQLGRLVDTQNDAVSNDTLMMTMGMLFLWPALFFIEGDQAVGQIADLKRQKEAIQGAMAENGC
jgi:hypothetical protein